MAAGGSWGPLGVQVGAGGCWGGNGVGSMGEGGILQDTAPPQPWEGTSTGVDLAPGFTSLQWQ